MALSPWNSNNLEQLVLKGLNCLTVTQPFGKEFQTAHSEYMLTDLSLCEQYDKVCYSR